MRICILILINIAFLAAEANAQSELIGTCVFGGPSGKGSVFRTKTGSTTIDSVIPFDGINGANPEAALVLCSTGKYYGTTNTGGINDLGTLFEFNPATNSIIKKIDFAGSSNGSSPYGDLVEAQNGKLYGLTWGGGANGKGALFEFDPATTNLVKIVDFGGPNGDYPWSTMVRHSNNKLYGTTIHGGNGNSGLIFEFDPSTKVLTKKIDFNDNSMGSMSWFKFTLSSDGKLIGVALKATSSVIFQYDPQTNTLIEKATFPNNSRPVGAMVQAPDGSFYGVSDTGGNTGYGFLFSYNPSTQIITQKVSFDFPNYPYGHTPRRGLVLSKNGRIYGTNKSGNPSSTLFEYDPSNNTMTKKLDFSAQTGTTPDNLTELCSNPKDAGTITSSVSAICEGSSTQVEFSTTQVLAADSYEWILPQNVEVKSGNGTAKVLVDWSKVADGTLAVQVTPKNACGNGPTSQVFFTIINRPEKPAISSRILSDGKIELTSTEASSYQWYKSGTLLPEVMTRIYVPDSDGTYTVVITTSGCTSAPSDPFQVVITGLEDNSDNSVHLVPNPAQDYIQLSTCEGEIIFVSVIDSFGRCVIDWISVKGLKNISVKDLACGRYFLLVQRSNKNQSITFIKT